MTETTTTSTGLADQQQQQQQLVAWPPLVPASFDKLDPSRKDQVFLYYEKDIAKTTATDGSSNSNNSNSNYRYKLTIIDRYIPLLPTTTTTSKPKLLAYATAVFLIPAGREAEYIFSSFHGLQNIAESAATARLVAVSFGRNHSFASQQAVQDELTFVVQILARQGSFLLSKSLSSLAKHLPLSSTSIANDIIPFMALDGIGRRNIIAEGRSTASGPYLVEQVKVDNDKQVRRLYFMNNPFVIQTEVFLLDNNNCDETTSSSSSNSSYSNNNKNGRPDFAVDGVVDKSRAAFDYHKIMAAGIMALSNCHAPPPPPPAQAAEAAINSDIIPSSALALISLSSSSSQRGLLIGLGGGGLVNYMSHVWPSPCTLTAIELDQTMVDIATKYFGLVPNPRKMEAANNNGSTLDGVENGGVVNLDVRIGNGLDISVAGAVPGNETSEATPAAANDGDAKSNTADADPSSDLSFAPGSMSFIVIDVDSKDNSKGMSCPPQSFIEIYYLERLSQILMNNETGGVLAINVSARDPEMLQLVCRNVNQVFNTVILSSNKTTTGDNKEESDDVNVVVFAKKSSQNDDDDDNDNNNILSNRNLLSDRLVTLLQRNPNINDECISDLKSTIQDFSMWNNNDGDGKSSQGVKKTGSGGGGGKKKPSRKKNKRGKKK